MYDVGFIVVIVFCFLLFCLFVFYLSDSLKLSREIKKKILLLQTSKIEIFWMGPEEGILQNNPQ